MQLLFKYCLVKFSNRLSDIRELIQTLISNNCVHKWGLISVIANIGELFMHEKSLLNTTVVTAYTVSGSHLPKQPASLALTYVRSTIILHSTSIADTSL